MAESGESKDRQRFVTCEACEAEVPRNLAHLHPIESCHVCDGCFRALTDFGSSADPERERS